VTETVGRRPAGPRKRRPLPALILLLVLALAAIGVWWNVLRADAAHDREVAAACSSASAAPPSLDPTTVTLRVFNATDRPGLAGTVATELQARGFVVAEIANDSADVDVTGVGELRFGPMGAEAADFVRVFLPGATDRPDTRADDRVDLVIGPDFQSLAPADQVSAALAPAASASAASC
jgi:hypothetical protein